jgi:hypothetical protein
VVSGAVGLFVSDLRLRGLSYLLLLFAALGCDDGSPGTGGDGGTDTGEPVCLDPDGSPAATCAVDAMKIPCPDAPNPDCAHERPVEVSTTSVGDPCLRLELQNDCEDTVYAWQCIEHLDEDGEPTWQCWLSTIWPGFSADVAECPATGTYMQYWSTESSRLDIAESACAP